MTGNELILDTSVVIDLFKGKLPVFELIEKQQTVYIPTVVLGELYLGAYRSGNQQKHLQQIKDFLTRCTVLYADHITADHYAVIKTALLKKGNPIPENDIWIAATAQQYELPLYTTDNHFREVTGLDLI